MDGTPTPYSPMHRTLPALALGLALSLGAACAWADWDVTVGATSAHGTWSNGNPNVWTPNGSGATVAASEIAARLAGGTPVVINTSGGGGAENGDLTVSSGLAWSANSLTLHAARNIAINASLNGSGTARLALEYGQGALAAGNTAQYTLGGGAKANLPAGANFSKKLGSDGGTTTWTVITSLGLEGDASVMPAPMTLQGMNTGLAGNYVLGADIDASSTAGWNGGLGFTPIGHDSGTPFTGKFDGLGHTISGLTINLAGGNNRSYGLFGATNNALLQNVGLLNVAITGGSNGATGALAGEIRGSTAVHNSYVDGGSVSTVTQAIGGLVGVVNAAGASVSYSHADVSVSAALGGGSGQASAGGLVGINNGAISYSYAKGSVSTPTGSSSGKEVGGLVGRQNNGSISYSFATGAVSGNNTLGGLLGTMAGGTVTNSYWDKDTTGQSTSAGSPASDGKTTAEMHSASFWNSTGWDSDYVHDIVFASLSIFLAPVGSGGAAIPTLSPWGLLLLSLLLAGWTWRAGRMQKSSRSTKGQR